MSWKEVTIGSFLRERPDRIEPNQANFLGLKRIEKIDFSGNIYLADNTSTRTNMILVRPGDLVISGINVAKGALAVYEGKEDVLATIHYSSYEFDKSVIDIEYLKWFLISNKFMNILKEQVGGGIKTELKPKKFLSLKIKLPDINLQKEIAKKINNVYDEIELLKVTNEENYELISKLRQSILQEAVQGKLVPQDPNDEPASVLLERIKEEKERLIKEGKIKKEKPLPPISEDEIPYELPEGWEWVRLGEIAIINPRNDIDDDVEVSFIPMKLIEDGFSNKHTSEIKKWKDVKNGFTHFQEGDVVIAKITPCFQNRKSAVMRNLKNGYGAGTTELYVVRTYTNTVLPEYLLALFKTKHLLRRSCNLYWYCRTTTVKRTILKIYYFLYPH